MVLYAVIGCSNRSGRDKVSFYTLPSVIKNQCQKTFEFSVRRRNVWLARLSRQDLKESSNPRNTRVCSKHFITGKASKLFDDVNPDWAPSIELGHTKLSSNATERYNRKRKRMVTSHPEALTIEVNNVHETEESVPEIINAQPPERVSSLSESNDENSVCCTPDVGCSTDLTSLDIAKLELENKMLKEEVNNLKLKINNYEITEESFKNSDKKVHFYTGLSSFALLMAVFHFVRANMQESAHNSLNQFQEFVLFLMRLRLNLSLKDLAFRFGISQSTVSRIIDRWLDTSYERLGCLIVWPEHDDLQKTMPVVFQKSFGKKVSVIIDCFEVFIDRPTSLLPRAITWSNYKHNNTVKFLIGITPQGAISFISDGWGGRASDKFITEHCGILNNLLPGDLVLADRGFDIAESVGFSCAELVLPAFTRGKKQLSSLEIKETRKLASLRIHVERVIGLVRNKYHILQCRLPIESLTCKLSKKVSPIDQIVSVCCALTNLSQSIISFD